MAKKNPRIVYDWQRSLSERSSKGWETRWAKAFERGEKLGPKGAAYIERVYGPTISGAGPRPTGGAGKRGREPGDEWDDYIDPDFDSDEDCMMATGSSYARGYTRAGGVLRRR